jgi:outer membrane protein OmpA-like peptidoglycan-associated protein
METHVNDGSAQEEHWIPLSDLMTGLMALFLLIAISYMVKIEADAAQIKEVAVAYSEVRDAMYADLQKEFADDLPRWRAQIDKEQLAIRFTEPEVLFDLGSAELKPKFRDILDDFFPRYLAILTSEKYRDSIAEVRIEGHTSSRWNQDTQVGDSYFRNMELSQARTRSTLRYVMANPKVAENQEWLKQFVTANGLSSSHLIRDLNGLEDPDRSQRVEFRVRTDAEVRIAKILSLEQSTP